MSKPKRVALLWHFHQPYYKNPFTGIFQLPWTRVHALKDYLGMGLILQKFPKLKVNFNFVPSLLLQIEEYLQGTEDTFSIIFKKESNTLSDEERYFVVRYFFSTNLQNHIQPFPRYYELYQKKMNNLQPEGNEKWGRIFSTEEIRDICCLFQLTCTDLYYRQTNPEIRELIKKKSFFSEDDKKVLLAIEAEILGRIIPLYRELFDQQQIEISTSPFYHPILPLLYNPQYARQANPTIDPFELNFSWPEDAEFQLKKALAFMEKRFGRKIRGIWPSEGSLSEEVIELFCNNSLLWTATDEKLLIRSLNKTGEIAQHNFQEQHKYLTYQLKEYPLRIFFRNQELSDLIGFTYQHYAPQKAATDLYSRIKQLNLPPEGVISIILDGENAWEFYPQSGRTFLEEFYRLLSNDNEIETVLFSELAAESKPRKLENFSAGSWIYANFDIWMGDREDRAAWEALKKVRTNLFESSIQFSPEIFSKAYEHILIAEGSDWFWWYGKENYTPDLDIFDLLFRANLQKVLNVLQIPNDGSLIRPFYQQIRQSHLQIELPRSTLKIKVDGEESSYLEWLDSGQVQIHFYGGAMHLADPIVHLIRFGFDDKRIFLRFDTKKRADDYFANGFYFCIELQSASCSLQICFPRTKDNDQISVGCGKIIELAIPFSLLKVNPGENFCFHFFWKLEEMVVQRFPQTQEIILKIPTETYYRQFWQV